MFSLYFWCLPIIFIILPSSMSKMLYLCFLYFILITFLVLKTKGVSLRQIVDRKKGIYIGGISFCLNVILCVLFYIRWYAFSIVGRVADIVGISSTVLWLMIIIALFAVGTISIFVLISCFYYVVKCSNNHNIKLWLMNRIEQKNGRILSSFVLTFLFWAIQNSFPIYIDGDNYWNSIVLNGLFSEENYYQYVNPIVAYIVRGIDGLFKQADGYVLLCEVLMFLGIWCLLYVFASYGISRFYYLCIWMTLVSLNFKLNIVHVNFTIVAGAFTAVGIISIFAYTHKKVGKISLLCGMILMVFGSMWRLSAQAMFIPFVILMMVVEIWIRIGNKKELIHHVKRTCMVVLPVILMIGICFCYDKQVKLSEKYSDSIEYNSLRSTMLDFPMKSFNDVEEQLADIGVSQNDYETISSWIFADTDLVDTNYLRSLLEIVDADKDDIMDDMQYTLSKLYDSIFNSGSLLVQLMFFALIFLIVSFSKYDIRYKLELIFSYLGAGVILLGFVFVGRIPVRVVQTLFFCVWCVVAHVLLSNVEYRKLSDVKKMTFFGGIVLAVFVNAITGMEYDFSLKLPSSLYAKTNQTYSFESVDESSDTVYICGISDYYNDYVMPILWKEDALPTTQFMNQNIIDGGCAYGQVYFLEYLYRIGIENPMSALIQREHTYYVAEEERCNCVLQFLREHYNENTQVECVGMTAGVPVWEFHIP